jgi:uncharacterized protein (TIGR00255 family)
MIQSMTGFGKASSTYAGIEIRCLNSKQLDIGLRIPHIFSDIEAGMRNMIAEKLERGKVDIFIQLVDSGRKSKTTFNKDIAFQYYKELKSLAKKLKEKNTQYMPLLLRMPELFVTDEPGAGNKEKKEITHLLDKALQQVIKFRLTEGKSLQDDIALHLSAIEKGELAIAQLDSRRIAKIRERIQAKITEYLAGQSPDANRFEQEIIYYIERLDINEELSRLTSHCNYFRQVLTAKNGGRKLGFITQEMGREINTIGSKANDAGIQKLVVDMKDELEKIKEQLLNVL